MRYISFRELPVLIGNVVSYQVDLPSLGRDRHHTVNLPANLHIHRSEGQLPSWEYPRLEVSLSFSSPPPKDLGLDTNSIILPSAAISCSPQGSSSHQTARAAMARTPSSVLCSPCALSPSLCACSGLLLRTRDGRRAVIFLNYS